MSSIMRIVLLSAAGMFLAAPACAAVWTVTKTADTRDNVCDADCSLREAIFAAAPSGDEIQFASPLFDSPQTIVTNLAGTSVLVNKSITITGKGAHLLAIRRDPGPILNYPIFRIDVAGQVHLSGMTITGGTSRGGIDIVGGATTAVVTVTNCVITANSGIAAGINVSNNQILNLINSTVSNNTSVTGSGQTAGGISINAATTNIINSTISGNTVTGGAIRTSGGGIVDITNSTISNNSTDGSSATNAGGIANFLGTVTIRNSIIAGNIGTEPDVYGNINGQYVSQGYNLISKNDGAAANFPAGNPNANNDLVGTIAGPVDARLDLLGMYGGTTPTHRLQLSPIVSPAIDKGSNLGGLTTDQRGFPRPYDDPLIPNSGGANANGSDIGAFELQAVSASNVSVGGRVFDSSGHAVFRARVTIVDAIGDARTALTNQFGFYRFDGVLTGETYIFQIRHKQHAFTPQMVTITGEIGDLNFTAEP